MGATELEASNCCSWHPAVFVQIVKIVLLFWFIASVSHFRSPSSPWDLRSNVQEAC
jgi:hypothetical protein